MVRVTWIKATGNKFFYHAYITRKRTKFSNVRFPILFLRKVDSKIASVTCRAFFEIAKAAAIFFCDLSIQYTYRYEGGQFVKDIYLRVNFIFFFLSTSGKVENQKPFSKNTISYVSGVISMAALLYTRSRISDSISKRKMDNAV